MSGLKWKILLLLLGLTSSIYLMVEVTNSEKIKLDDNLNEFVLSVFTEKSAPFFNVITELGDIKGIAIVVFIMLIWLVFKKRDFTGVIVLVLSVALGNEWSKWLKELVGRERPVTAELAESLSFPSGHAMVGLILYFVCSYLLVKHLNSVKFKWGIAMISFIVVLLIGLSRIVLQDHYPTDVMGGYAIGLVWSILWVSAYDALHKRISYKREKQYPLNQ